MPDSPTGLLLQPLGPELNHVDFSEDGEVLDQPQRTAVVLARSSPWADFALRIEVYRNDPGLLHYSVELTAHGSPPNETASPEWAFVDVQTGE